MDVGFRLQLYERIGGLGAAAAGARNMNAETLAIQVPHEMSVNDRVSPVTLLRLNEQDTEFS